MVVSVLFWCNILCLLVVVFFNPTQIIKIRTLSLSLSLSPSVSVRHLEWRHVGVQSQRSRSVPYKRSRLGLETAPLRRYFTKNTGVYYLLK